MTKQNNAAVFAQAFRHFQADFVSEGHARTYSLSAMLKNLQSTDPDKQAQTKTEAIATLNQVAGALADLTAEGAGKPSADVLMLLGGVVALCADVINADTYAHYQEKGNGHETK